MRSPTLLWPLLLLLPASAAANEYLDEVHRLPAEYTEGGCNPGASVPEPIQKAKDALTKRYSWAIPTDEAIAAIAAFAPQIVDLGAGAGYWDHLLADAGADVVALDDWSWGRPAKLWHPVATGSERDVAPHWHRALMMVWPPRPERSWPGGQMAARALEVWHGDRVVYVGEIMRGNASPEFFSGLAREFHLVKRIAIPQWWNRSDAVFLLERGHSDDGEWMRRECGGKAL